MKTEITSLGAAITLLENEEKRNEALVKMVESEREMVAGYEQLAKVHSAYIAILLKKLEATKDNAVTVTGEEIKKAMEKYEARAMYEPTDKSWKLYCEVIAEE